MRIGGEVCTVKFWRIGITFLLVVAIVDACSIAYTRQLWSKKTGSKSNLFAFEKNGLVGFINASGKVVVDPTLAVRIEDVGDFSDGRARIKDAGYIDESGKLVIAGEYRYLYDFSDGLAQVFVNDTGANGRNSQFVDPEGKAVAMVRTEKVYDYSENLAAFEKLHFNFKSRCRPRPEGPVQDHHREVREGRTPCASSGWTSGRCPRSSFPQN